MAGTQATLQKEEIQLEIEEHMEMGTKGLLDEDLWMMEVNLEDKETTSGEREVLASSHSSWKGGWDAYTATRSTGSGETLAGWALVYLTSVNPCANRVGWLSVANLTGDHCHRRRDALSLAVPTAALFG